MKTIEEVKEFFVKGDKFMSHVGIKADSAESGRAVCSLELGPEHYNANGLVQGGVIYTLADTAFALAANTENFTVTLSGAIRYLNRTEGKKLFAGAKVIKASKKICFYEVSIEDDTGVQVALAEFTGYIK